MRVDYATVGQEPQENSKPDRAEQTRASGKVASSNSASTLGSTSNSTSSLDQVRLSFDQTRVQSLAAQVLAQPEIRQGRVESLQQAIGSDEYSVPASRVADALASELGAS